MLEVRLLEAREYLDEDILRQVLSGSCPWNEPMRQRRERSQRLLLRPQAAPAAISRAA